MLILPLFAGEPFVFLDENLKGGGPFNYPISLLNPTEPDNWRCRAARKTMTLSGDY